MPRGFKWYLVGHGGTLDKMSRGRRRMRKGEPVVDSNKSACFEFRKRKKKMETEVPEA